MALNVLVVDDSLMMRRMVCRALKSGGMPIDDIAQAANGKEAQDSILEGRTFDLVCLDLNMPVMGGLDLLRWLRTTEPHQTLPVIVVSSEGNVDRIEEVKSLNAAMIRKPFTPEQLVRAFLEAVA
ncbi:MAG: response regulator [Myxococcota bacterium]